MRPLCLPFAARLRLGELGLLATSGAPAVHRFLSSGDIAWFTDLGSRLLGPELRSAARWQPAA